ncbi:MAG: GGDEF domain-containing protein [Methylorubrum populi]
MSETATDLDRLLRFSPSVAEHYEREYGWQRAADLRRNAFAGLIVYNIYNFTSIVLTPDVLDLAFLTRTVLFTPLALLLIWLIDRVAAVQRERLALAAMIGGFLPPAVLFWLTEAPFGTYCFSELALAVIFGNIVLALRFVDAIVLTGVAFVFAALAVVTKPGLAGGLSGALLIQLATACGFSLYANHQMEARRCRDYITGLRARLLREVAEQARQRFQDLSRTDALTGLPNRRALDLCLDQWLSSDGSVAVLMIDIDHFKRFNDTLGHLAGDDCLRRVADALATLGFARTDLICARYGGEEFALVLNGGGQGEATRLADDLVKAVASLGIPHPGRRDGLDVVTVSVGVAACRVDPQADRTANRKAALLAAADRALYEAKRRGRNRAFVGGPEAIGLALAG